MTATQRAATVPARPPAVPRPQPPPPLPRAAPAPDVPARPAPTADLDEVTLVVRAQEGDVRAFEELARRHQTGLYRLAVRVLGDPADAEDALQDALLDGWRKIAGFRGDAAFSTWMYRIVTHRCLTVLRRGATAVPVAELPEDAGPAGGPGGSPERAAELDAGMTALGAALARLPDDQRICFVLRELEGLGYAEIADITGATEVAVRGRIHRGRRTLAEVMRPWR